MDDKTRAAIQTLLDIIHDAIDAAADTEDSEREAEYAATFDDWLDADTGVMRDAGGTIRVEAGEGRRYLITVTRTADIPYIPDMFTP